jgi:hypothetical protein
MELQATSETPVFDGLYDAFVLAGYDGLSAIEYANGAIREFKKSGKKSVIWVIGEQTLTIGRRSGK